MHTDREFSGAKKSLTVGYYKQAMLMRPWNSSPLSALRDYYFCAEIEEDGVRWYEMMCKNGHSKVVLEYLFFELLCK